MTTRGAGRALTSLLAMAVAMSAFGGGRAEQPRVVTPSGVFLGKEHFSARQGRKVFAFTKIPFAMPPTGPLRFMVRQERPRYDDIVGCL